MNVIDEAFIRAYQPEATPATSKPRVHRDAAGNSAGLKSSSEPTESQRTLSGTSAVAALTIESPTNGSDYFQVASTDIALEETPPEVAPAPTPTAEIPSVETPPNVPTPSTRRPLSTFVQSERTVEAVFRPELEVDAFRWPQVCVDLTTQWAGNFADLMTTIHAAAEGGRSLIGIAGLSEGVGATTLTLCLARLAAQAGKTTVLVDGNFTDPELATRLGLEVDSGWEQVLSGATPLASSVIYSQGDRLALLPLLAGGLRASEQIDTIHASVTAGVLRYHYDLVLVDLGSVAGGGQTAVARKLAQQLRLDACLVTADQAEPGRQTQFAALAPELAEVTLGLIQNSGDAGSRELKDSNAA